MIQMTTRYMPALPRLTQRANPWPSWQDVMMEGLQDFNYWMQRPKRPFPAANFCPLSARPAQSLREVPPEFDLAAWQAMCFRPAPVPLAIMRRKPLPRPKGRLETWLDNHRGALAFWKRKPIPVSQSDTPSDESWVL